MTTALATDLVAAIAPHYFAAHLGLSGWPELLLRTVVSAAGEPCFGTGESKCDCLVEFDESRIGAQRHLVLLDDAEVGFDGIQTRAVGRQVEQPDTCGFEGRALVLNLSADMTRG